MILHVDMDAFYASVEERENPELRGQPVVVGGTPQGRGVVAAANYVARKFGIHSAMPTGRALTLCPHAVVLRPRLDFYAEISKQIREIFQRFTPEIEPLSLDEAFLDTTGCERLFGSAETIGRAIKSAIREELHLIASVGVAPNKFLAKLASDLDKPDGFTVIPPDRVQEIIDPLPVERIWGVGKVTGQKFDRAAVRTFGDLRKLPQEHVKVLFGRAGQHFWQLAQGIDDRRVVPDRVAKSISNETTFGSDIQELGTLEAWMMELTDQVARRMRQGKRKGRTVTIKVRYHDFYTITRAESLAEATHATELIRRTAINLLRTELPDRPLRIRLLGLGVSNLDKSGPVQLKLFDEGVELQQTQLDSTTDRIRAIFGNDAVRRGSSIDQGTRLKRSPRPDD